MRSASTKLEISGELAQFRASYVVAATVRQWRMKSWSETCSEVTNSFSGIVSRIDRFFATQSGLELWLYMGREREGAVWWVFKDAPRVNALTPGETVELIVKGMPTITARAS